MLSKQKNVMRHIIRKPRKLKVIYYYAYLFGINDYLSILPGAKQSDNIAKVKPNEILFSSMPNGCIKQSYVQGFDCEIIA